MKDENDHRERKALNAMTSLGLSGMIMIIAVLGLMRVFFSEEKAQSMERQTPSSAEHEAFHQAINECMDTVDVDEHGRPDREALEACMREKGFERPSGPPPCGIGKNGLMKFTPPPYSGEPDADDNRPVSESEQSREQE